MLTYIVNRALVRFNWNVTVGSDTLIFIKSRGKQEVERKRHRKGNYVHWN